MIVKTYRKRTRSVSEKCDVEIEDSFIDDGAYLRIAYRTKRMQKMKTRSSRTKETRAYSRITWRMMAKPCALEKRSLQLL